MSSWTTRAGQSKRLSRKIGSAIKVLFVDARHIYRQVDRAHRDWTDAQIGFISNIVRLYRGENPDFTLGGQETEAKLGEVFGSKFVYADVRGLCKVMPVSGLQSQGYSLNPGRYVGTAPGEVLTDEDFRQRFEELTEEFAALTVNAREAETTILRNAAGLLES